jgi:hypothetical protein
MSSPEINIENFDEFLRLIDPTILGILWITEEDFKEKEIPFYWLDYLWDGGMSRQLQDGGDIEKEQSFFVRQQFGRPFYLGQIKNSSPRLTEALDQFINLMKQAKDERKKILFLAKTQHHIPSSLVKKNKVFDFCRITLTQ